MTKQSKDSSGFVPLKNLVAQNAYRTAIMPQIRDAESEDLILRSENYEAMVKYAHDIIGGRWLEAESKIATNPRMASAYAIDIIGGRWSEGESAMASDANVAFLYAMEVIGGRWPEAEKTIATDARSSIGYAKYILKGPFEMAEENIMSISKDGKFSDRRAWEDYQAAIQEIVHQAIRELDFDDIKKALSHLNEVIIPNRNYRMP